MKEGGKGTQLKHTSPHPGCTTAKPTTNNQATNERTTPEDMGGVGVADDAPAETAAMHEAEQMDRDKKGHTEDNTRVRTTPILLDPTRMDPIGMSGERIASSKHPYAYTH
ncbi:hypothetical protein BDV93DRAFT_612407, partial [Ceratobasidium sp. AG-I]